MRVHFRLLGSMQLSVDDQPVKLPGAAERGLLALLLLSAGHPVTSSSLIDRLWSETSLPADPLNALQLRVSKLRRALAAQGVDVVVRDASGYRADVFPDDVDVHRFVTLVAAARAAARDGGDRERVLAAYDEALALWHGEPLADFAHETWATVESARLRQLHLAALTEQAEAALAAGRHVQVAADLEPVVADDPRQEALAGLLMTALYRSGRQADALDVFARTRRWLDDELGLQPSAALRLLHQRVLQQDVALDPPLTPPAATATSPGGTRAAAPAHTPGPREKADVARRSLPLRGVGLIGRDEELDAVARLLADRRAVTLVGPGGAGKTSLGVAVANAVAERFEHGVHLARLAALTNPADVPLAVADAVGVPLDGADPNGRVRDRLLAYLANRRLLLVLDNCEHVVDAVAGLVDLVLQGTESVTVLATSREALAVPGEVQVAVAPLDVPPPGACGSEVLDYPSARLFVERARSVRARLQLGDRDLAALATVCRQLDGMPLALELAAARMTSLSLPDLADRLRDRFGLLTTGPRTAEARQRTLRGAVQWSHALLSEPEQRVFRRLAVFHGGWTLDAAEAVVAGGDLPVTDVFDVLDRLVNRSMVVCDGGSPTTRYRMLETLRQYALEQLEQSGETEKIAAAHAAHFRRFADAADLSLRGPGQRATLHRLREEHANLRAALGWLSADSARVEDALQLAGALGLYWHLGRHVEGREVLAQVVATPGGSALARARALQAVSIVERPRACLVHPSPRCAQTARESLELFEAGGDVHGAALSRVLLAVELLDGSAPDRFEALLGAAEEQFTAENDEWGHGVVAFVRLQNFLRRGDEARAVATGRAASDAFRRLDDAWGLSAVLYHLGWGLKEFGRYADAVPVLEQAIEVASSAGVYNTAQWALSDLGVALLHLGQRDAARSCFDRASTASDETGDAAGDVLAALGRALVAQVDADPVAARALFDEALRGLERLRTPLWAGHALAGGAWCDWREGLLGAARDRYEHVRHLGERVGEPVLVAVGLEGLARVAAASHEPQRVADLLARAADVRKSARRPASPHEQAELDVLMEVVRTGVAATEASLRLGQQRPREDDGQGAAVTTS